MKRLSSAIFVVTLVFGVWVSARAQGRDHFSSPLVPCARRPRRLSRTFKRKVVTK